MLTIRLFPCSIRLRYAFQLLALLSAYMAFSAPVLADPTAPASAKSSASKNTKASSSSSSSGGSSSAIQASNNQIAYQTILTNVNYIETGNGIQTTAGTLNTEIGTVLGTAYYISVMNNAILGNDYFKLTYDQSSGYTNYLGANLNLPNGPPGPFGSVAGTSSAILTNIGARYGKGFNLTATSMLTPYIEMGTHSWFRGINAGETYTNNYYGYGLLNQYSFGKQLVLSIDAMAGHTNSSNIVVTSAPLITGFSAALGNSVLYKLGIYLDYALIQKIHLNAGIDYAAFSYGMSAVQASGLLEPDSRTSYTTVKFGLGIGF